MISRILKDEKGINPGYDDDYKAKTQALIDSHPNATHVVNSISIFEKVKK